jgi:hypothetical protein
MHISSIQNSRHVHKYSPWFGGAKGDAFDINDKKVIMLNQMFYKITSHKFNDG